MSLPARLPPPTGEPSTAKYPHACGVAAIPAINHETPLTVCLSPTLSARLVTVKPQSPLVPDGQAGAVGGLLGFIGTS